MDRSLSEHVASLKTDDLIAMYSAMAGARRDNPHYQALLASAYVQKTRETTDYSYLDRAVSILNGVLSADSSNYEALRLLTETELERHLFAQAAESSLQLIRISEADPWNWGTLGDAYIEMGDYEKGASAYQKMVALRPDLASYNRASHFRFLYGDVDGAVAIMQKAIQAGSPMKENVAWCLVDLGNIYLKTGRNGLARDAFQEALRAFPSYHPGYAGLGRVLAEAGNTQGAIENYRRAQQITPMPDYAAALFDLYNRTGDDAQAAKQMELLEMIDRVSRANGEQANRNLVFAFADHDVKLERALELAQGELEFRRDVYSYDALAWALYKNRRYGEAKIAMDKALQLGTPEPQFQRHARAIAEAMKEVAP
ncbi:MAG TPA: tetratricopeptide repeat protein [Bryobacteraceae bacterium]|nr:tetratricopeptide repeat protein [Bryobacteraceae bacterium]